MADTRYTCLALCAGSGMLEEGLGLALPGVRAMGYAEREGFAAAVLLARMEEQTLGVAPVWCGDLAAMDATPFLGVDFVTAGFSCQPFSGAGKRQGTDDDRWIWPDIVRVIRETGPRYVFLENVPGLLVPPAGQLAGIGHVLRDLASLGFDAEWCRLGAKDVGAPHVRRRVFILAYADGPRREAHQSESVEAAFDDVGRGGRVFPPGPDDRDGWVEALRKGCPEPTVRLLVDELARRVVQPEQTSRNDQLRLLGNGVVPSCCAVAFTILAVRAGLADIFWDTGWVPGIGVVDGQQDG